MTKTLKQTGVPITLLGEKGPPPAKAATITNGKKMTQGAVPGGGQGDDRKKTERMEKGGEELNSKKTGGKI